MDTTIVPFLNEDGKPRQYVAIRADITKRKAAEIALAKVAAIVESSDDAIMGKDMDGIITSWNKGAESIFGYTAGEMTGTSIMRLIPADREDEENHILGKIKRGENVEHFETLGKTKDGRLIHVSVTASPIKNAEGEIIGASKVARDISERIRVEDARRMSESRYRTLFDYAPDGIVIADANSFYLDANPSICRMLGYTREEFIGLHASNIVSQKEIQNIAPALGAIKSRTNYNREWQFHRKDGSVFDAEAIITVMPDGNLLGMIRNVTERKQFEKEMRIAHEKMRQLLTYSPAVIYTLKIYGETITPVVVSDNIERLLGFIAEEANTYRWWVDHLHPEDRDRALATLQVALTQNGYSMEYRILHKDGTYRWVEDNNRLLRDTNGRPDFMVGIWTDISERKHAEEVLRKVSKQENSRKNVRVLWDLAVIFGLGVLTFAVFYFTDVLVAPLNKLVFEFKDNLDDLFLPPVILLLGLLIFSYRRWRDAQGRVSEQANIQETLRKLHGELEKRIHQRTVELSQTNDALRTEISERKRAEEARRASEARYHTLFDYAPDGIVVVDPKGYYLDVNASICRMLGYTRDEFIGLNATDIVAPAEIPHIGQALDVIKTKSDYHREWQFRRKDGSVFAVDTIATAMPDGNLLALIRDITERKRAEESLRLLSSAVEQSKESILITDAELDLPGPKIIFVNPAFTQMTGYTAEEVIGKTPRILQGSRTDKTVLSRLRQNLEQGETFAGEAINYRKDGMEFDLEWQIAPLRNASGKITHFVATQHDITARKKLEVQFRQSQKMEGIGQLAGGVAHDFNNILAVIQMQSDLLKADGNLSPTQLEFANDIGAASQRAAALTRQLLMFSRKQTMKPCDLDFNESINDMTKMLRRTIGEDIQLQFKFSMQPLFIHADAGMMDQVLMNLAINSRDAMPEGGQLVIETSAVDFDESVRAQSAYARPGSFICLSVSDTGCGIPHENLQKIFEPFFTTKDVGKGTGLGLATVFGIVQQHNGWINVYSEVGRGTTFRIYLPRLSGISGQKPEQPMLTAIRGGNETILLVEDDAFLRASVRKALTQLGYRVLEAVNGVEALDVWNQHSDEINLLLTDLVMPGGINGIELAGQLLETNPKLKVIYASGYSAEVASKDFPLEEGVNFLTKPFQVQKLAQTIRNILDKPA